MSHSVGILCLSGCPWTVMVSWYPAGHPLSFSGVGESPFFRRALSWKAGVVKAPRVRQQGAWSSNCQQHSAGLCILVTFVQMVPCAARAVLPQLGLWPFQPFPPWRCWVIWARGHLHWNHAILCASGQSCDNRGLGSPLYFQWRADIQGDQTHRAAPPHVWFERVPLPALKIKIKIIFENMGIVMPLFTYLASKSNG